MNRFRTTAICAGLMALSGVAGAAHHESGHAPGGAATEHRGEMGDANQNAQPGGDAERGQDRAADRRDEHADEHGQGGSHAAQPGPRGEPGHNHSDH